MLRSDRALLYLTTIVKYARVYGRNLTVKKHLWTHSAWRLQKRPFLGKGLLLEELGIDQVAVEGAHECSHVILVTIITNGNQLWKGSMLLKVLCRCCCSGLIGRRTPDD